MFASPIFWQIRYLVTNLTKKNLKSSISELNQLIELYGEDARLFLLQCLVEETGFKEQRAHTHHGNKDNLKIQLLQHELAQAADESNFVSAICRALEGTPSGTGGPGSRDRGDQGHGRQRGGGQGQQGAHRITEDFLLGYCRTLKLSPQQQVAVGLGLARSANAAVAKEGVKFLVARVPGLLGGGGGGGGGGGAAASGGGQLSLEALHSLLELVNSNEEIAAQPDLAKSLLGQIREAHQECLKSIHGTATVGKGGGSGGETASGESGQRNSTAAAGGGGGGVPSSSISLYEADALALVPLFTEHASSTGEMNFLNKTSGAMSLAADVAGIATSIGQGGSLAGFLRDLGHTCCSSTASLRQAIRESGVVVDERQVAQLMTMLANNYNSPKGQGDDGELSSALTSSLFSAGDAKMAGDAGRDSVAASGQGQGLWKLEVARQVLAEDYGPRLDWVAVARALDHERFNIPDQNALRVLLALYRGPAGRDIPLEALYMQWQNRRGHLSLLRAAILAPPQVFTFASSPSKQAPLEGVDTANATPNGAWLSLDLVASLLSLASDTELYAQVRDVFSKPAYQCPELLLLALAAVPSEAGGSLRVEMLSRLLPLYFRPNRNKHAAALIRRLWQVNARLVVQSGVKAFNVDSTLPSVVYVLRIMRLVPECTAELLGADDCAFAVAVASVAFGAEVPASSNAQQPPPPNPLPPLDLEKWAAERLGRKDREVFAARVLTFVQLHFPMARMRSVSQKPGETPGEGLLPTCTMSLEAAAILLKALGATGLVSPAAEALLKKNPAIQASAKQLAEDGKKMHPTLNQLLNPPEEIESMANSYFHRIYTAEQSIEEVIAMLERFKSSSDTREQEIFACMVHNLFDEYRFFHNYPEKELRITGVLFGSLIQHQLVSSITLGIALRYVLEALRRPPGPDPAGKMFRFGMFALEQFKGRLGEWPQYCSHIVQIPHLVGNHPALVEEIERSMQRQGGGGGGGGGGAAASARAPAASTEVGTVAAALGSIVAAAAPSNLAQSVSATSVGGPIGRSQQGDEGQQQQQQQQQSQLLAARSKVADGAIGDHGPSLIGGGQQQQQQQQQRLPPGPSTPGRNTAAQVARSPGGDQGLGRQGGDHQLMGQGAMGNLGGGIGGGVGTMGMGGQSQAGGGVQIGRGQGGGPSAMQQMSQQQAQQQQQQQQQRGQLPPGASPLRNSGSPEEAAAASNAPGNKLMGSSPAAGTNGKEAAGDGNAGLGLDDSLAFGGLGRHAAAMGQSATGTMVRRGVGADAPGHETWGSSTAAENLRQNGGAAGGSAAGDLAASKNGSAVPLKKSRGGAIPPKSPGGLGTPNMDILMAKVEDPTPLVNPPEAVMDRIHFVINNVTTSNLSSKVAEIKSHIQNHPEHHGWLANYLVVKRICTQPNFHDLYLELVKQLETPPLMDAILKSVFHNVGKLLRSHKIITSTSERSLLKNLGSWLGKITLGRDKPVLQRELDVKELLFQGYETGRLIAVTPFVAKILEGAPSCNSRVFKPPNPWIMGLFSALHEMYELQDLKMNIKFEIEMLCQKFNVTIADVPMYGRLRTRMTPAKEKNPDFNLTAHRAAARAEAERLREEAAASAAQGGNAGTGGSPDGGAGRGGEDGRAGGDQGRGASDGGAGRAQAGAGAGTGAGAAQKQQDQQTVIPNLASYVTINPTLDVFAAQPHLKEVLKRVVPVAVDRAIREIIQPVVERSVTIACITSKELVQKDFAMEADENKMRKAAHLMVSNLAGSLALVTCKEPLRVSIGNHMRSLLSTAVPNADQATTEMLVHLCSSENLELGCMLIEKAATEKAMRDIDEAVAPALQARRKSRETTGQPFYDMSIFNNLRYPGALPDSLRPKPGGLHPQQLLVYEAFQRVPRQPSVTRSPAGPSGIAGPGGGGGPGPQQGGSAGGGAGPSPRLLPAASPASPALGGMQGGGASVVPGRGLSPKGMELTLDQALSAWQGAIGRLDMAIGGLLTAHRRGGGGPELTLHAANRDQDLSASLQEIVTVGKSVPLSSREEALTKFARAVFNRLFEMARGHEDNPAAVPLLRVEVYAAVLELCLRTVRTSLTAGRHKEDLLTQWYTGLPPQAIVGPGSRKLHLGALKYLVQMNMLDLEKTDAFLAGNIALTYNGEDPQKGSQLHQRIQQLQEEWGLYAVALIRQCVFEHSDASAVDGKVYQVSTMKSFAKTLETLSHLQGDKKPVLAQQFLKLASDLRVATHQDHGRKAPGDIKSPLASPAGPQGHGGSGQGAGPGRTDPIGAREEVTQILHYWMRLLNDSSAGDEKTAATIMQVLQQRNALKSDESIERFLRVATDLVVEVCLKSGRPPAGAPAAGGAVDKPKQLSYVVVDAYVKLLLVVVRSAKPDHSAAVALNARCGMLDKVLKIISRALMQDFETKKAAGAATLGPFDQRPYFRIFLDIIEELNKPDRQLDNTSLQVLATLAEAFHKLQPALCPGFAFSWLELISHRSFMPKLLLMKQNKGWMDMHRLLIALLAFMEPHLRRPTLLESVRLLYQGMLRTLLVLLHDFPEFLSDYHLSFCDVIPPTCIQLRNLILAAFPRSMRLPDPFTPNLKVDLLPEIALAPRILSNYVAALSHNGIKQDLDKFLQTRHQPVNFLAELPARLRHSPQEAAHTGMTYNMSCINSLAVYVGSQAILQLNNKTPIITHSASMDVFHQLANKLDPEGRYFFLNAIANQLRYPNQHTHYFSCVLLYLFAEAQSEMVQEQITRILLERLIVHRPHPWGLLITFIELIKNPRYSFWSHSFTHCAPELERVFESVARSCMTPGAATGAGVDDAVAAGQAQ